MENLSKDLQKQCRKNTGQKHEEYYKEKIDKYTETNKQNGVHNNNNKTIKKSQMKTPC